MPKREYLIVMRDRPDELLDCYSRHYVAHSKTEAIENFMKWELGIRGDALKRFLEENNNGSMLRVLPYSHDIGKMKEIFATRRATAAMGNRLPGYLDKYRRSTLPEKDPVREEITIITTPTLKTPEPRTMKDGGKVRNKKDLPDWEMDLLRHLNVEHKYEREDDEYNYDK